VADSDVDTHPVRGSADPTSLVCMCRDYVVKFKPRNKEILEERLKEADKRLRGFEEA
jgi:3-hydroxyphenylacetate 6-hydroxylase